MSKIEKLLEYVFNTQIKSMVYLEDFGIGVENEKGLIVLGFREGRIQSFYLSVEVDTEDPEGSESDGDNDDDFNNTNNNFEISNLAMPIKVQDKKSLPN